MLRSGHGSAKVERPGRSGFPAGRRGPARRHVDPAAVARRLAGVVHWPGALDVSERAWRLVAQAPDFDAWLIAWPGGGTVDLHDHGGSRGAVVVMNGALTETVPWRDGAGQLTFAQRELRSGVTLAFGAGHVHDVRNESSTHALSLHVYSPPLTSMTYYDCFEGRLVPRQNEWDIRHDHELGQAPRLDRPDLRLVAP